MRDTSYFVLIKTLCLLYKLLTEQLNRTQWLRPQGRYYFITQHTPLAFIASDLLLFSPLLSPLLSSLVPGRHGDSAFPKPATRIPIRLACPRKHTHVRACMHARIAPVWRCQRPDESNDRLTSVYRPRLTSPWAAHKQLISLSSFCRLLFFLVLCFCPALCFFFFFLFCLSLLCLHFVFISSSHYCNWVGTIGLSAAARSAVSLL